MPAAAQTMLIWKTSGEAPSPVYTVQEPTGAIQTGLSLGDVRKLAVTNRWAVEYPKTAAPAAGPGA